MGFVDDITLLTYSKSTYRNVKNLEKAYNECLKWANRHGATFNPEKSELIHFTRGLGASREITLEGNTIKPSIAIKLLGIHLNRDLSPKHHLERLKGRLPGLLNLLGSISRSTWGLKLEIARKIYLGAIRPVLAYGAIAWYPLY
jgi:Reverse transcriptase (RNA-dependent DNA polymerase)